MDSECPGMSMWLVRGIPRGCEEVDVVRTLRQLGLLQPSFWYMPRIRKQHLQNRGYAFLGYSATDDNEAQRFAQRAAVRCFPWPLQLERSTSRTENMENNATIWAAPFVAQGTLDTKGMHPQASRPHYLEQWQPAALEARQHKPRQPESYLSLCAPPHSTETIELMIQGRQSTQSLDSVEPCTCAYYDLGHGCIVWGDNKFPVVRGLPVFV
eukprot:TRINITY_DN13411_c0_g1_i1.p1 TRINITY_DN13411_c0_g1~~TRINITY_DN13411_c0_g1_i1.p1  ORF type:complete len:211 (+),score=16.36 TRINITY_DN13411_c0_g1_i1:156-788(+)